MLFFSNDAERIPHFDRWIFWKIFISSKPYIGHQRNSKYYQRVKIYASAIREACPDCIIIMGSLLDNVPGDRDLEQYLEKFLQLGGGEYIDVYNFHYYGAAKPTPGFAKYYRSGEEIYHSMKTILKKYGYEDKPIWVTETSTFSGKVGQTYQSEEEQRPGSSRGLLLLLKEVKYNTV